VLARIVLKYTSYPTDISVRLGQMIQNSSSSIIQRYKQASFKGHPLSHFTRIIYKANGNVRGTAFAMNYFQLT
jgi:hypothetical protein